MANHLAQWIQNESLNRFHSSRLNETQMLPMPDPVIRLLCIFTKFALNYSSGNKQNQKPKCRRIYAGFCLIHYFCMACNAHRIQFSHYYHWIRRNYFNGECYLRFVYDSNKSILIPYDNERWAAAESRTESFIHSLYSLDFHKASLYRLNTHPNNNLKSNLSALALT